MPYPTEVPRTHRGKPTPTPTIRPRRRPQQGRLSALSCPWASHRPFIAASLPHPHTRLSTTDLHTRKIAHLILPLHSPLTPLRFILSARSACHAGSTVVAFATPTPRRSHGSHAQQRVSCPHRHRNQAWMGGRLREGRLLLLRVGSPAFASPPVATVRAPY